MGDLKAPSSKPQGVTYPVYPPGKPQSPWEECLAVLRKLLQQFLRCLTCGCYDGGFYDDDDLHADVGYEGYIMDEEKEAVENLLGDLYSSCE